jgi:hypothetical protein
MPLPLWVPPCPSDGAPCSHLNGCHPGPMQAHFLTAADGWPREPAYSTAAAADKCLHALEARTNVRRRRTPESGQNRYCCSRQPGSELTKTRSFCRFDHQGCGARRREQAIVRPSWTAASALRTGVPLAGRAAATVRHPPTGQLRQERTPGNGGGVHSTGGEPSKLIRGNQRLNRAGAATPRLLSWRAPLRKAAMGARQGPTLRMKTVRRHCRRLVSGAAKRRRPLYFSLRCFPRNSIVRFQASLASSGR